MIRENGHGKILVKTVSRITVFALAAVIVWSSVCGVNANAASGLYGAVTGEFYGLGRCEDKGYYRKELSLGVQNTLLRARQMQEITWSPLEDMYMYANSDTTGKLFKAGYTYQGLPYGQPVHVGKYIGFNLTIDEFAAAVQDENNEFYTERGQNTWYYEEQAGDGKIRFGPYLATDCSSFVSYCWQLDARTTTAMMSEDPERFIIVGNDVQQLEPGFAINSPGNHVILIYDVVYDSDGKVASVTTIEQTPPMMVMRTYGLGGTKGTLDDLQAKLDGTYDIIRYRDIESVTYEAAESVKVDSKTYVSGLELPLSITAADEAVTGTVKVSDDDETVEISGWALHKEGFESFEYSIDGGKARTVKSGRDADYCAGNTLYYEFADIGGKNCYSAEIETAAVVGKELVIYGVVKGGERVEVAKLSVEKRAVGDLGFSTDTYFDTPWIYADEDGVCRGEVEVSGEDDLLVPFNGWSVCSDDILRFEMSIDGGVWMNVESTFRDDVYSIKTGNFSNCRNNNAFSGVIDLRYLGIYGEHTVVLRAVTADNEVYEVAEWEFEYENADIIEIVCLAAGGALLIALVIFVIVRVVNAAGKKAEKAETAYAVSAETVISEIDKTVESSEVSCIAETAYASEENEGNEKPDVPEDTENGGDKE